MTRLVAFVLLLTAALALMLMFFLSHIVQYGITAKTGFPTHVEDLSSNPLRGTLRASGFEVRNPPHYSQPRFLEIERLDLRVSPGSLFRNRIEVENFELKVPRLTGIRNAEGRINLEEFGSVIEEMLDDRRSREPEKEVVIKRFRLKIDKVELLDYSHPSGDRAEEYRVDVDLELTNVTSLRNVAPEVLRRFAAAGISFERDAVFAGAVPEALASRIRSELGIAEEVKKNGF